MLNEIVAQQVHTYNNYAFNNKVLDGNVIHSLGPSFIEEDLIFTLDLSSKQKEYNYLIEFGKSADIVFIGLVFGNKTYGNKHLYQGHIKIKGEDLKNCIVLSKDNIEKYFLGDIKETYPYELILNQCIEIIYDGMFGESLRYLYPIKLRTEYEDVIEEGMKKTDEIKLNSILNDKDVNQLSKLELKLLRNEIFARHGYIFKSKDLQEYFSKKSWYNPQYEDITHKLTDIDKQNIELILKHENLKK